VAFSSCFARRLVELLANDSLLRLVDRVYWSDMYSLDGVTRSERKTALVEALGGDDPFALSELWEAQSEWHGDVGNALPTCVRALVKTDYEDHKVFNVLWVPKDEKRRCV
jgi:hypothetical protein